MPLSSQAGIRDADRRGWSFLPPGDHSEYGDLKRAAPECLLRVPESLAQARVRAASIVMSDPLLEKSLHVFLVDRNQEIQTLAPDGSDQAFAESVRLRRA